MQTDKQLLANRWRLVLGKYAQESMFGHCTGADDIGSNGGIGEFAYRELDDLMEFLYGREYSENRDIMEGSLDGSNLTIPKWINKIHELFPKETIEKLQNHALERYELTGLLTDSRVLETLEPNMALLKQVLSLKGMMSQEVLATARRIIKTVVDELTQKMELQIRQSILGKRDRFRSSPFKCARNLDFKRTIIKNLKNFDREQQRLAVERVYFNRNVKRFNPWRVIICVDESGSMMENVIHSAVMSSIFAKLPTMSTKLVIFDTQVVDLSNYLDDPVETLMNVQLGGGTDIGRALAYCESLIETPHRTIVVLVSDLCDGAGYAPMYRYANNILEAGSKLICLTALDNDCAGMYDRNAAKKLSQMGAHVAALTPGKLADWIGELINS